MIAFPIPAPVGAPPWIGVLFVIAGAGVLAVLIWQAVRFFRDDRAQTRAEHEREHEHEQHSQDGDDPKAD